MFEVKLFEDDDTSIIQAVVGYNPSGLLGCHSISIANPNVAFYARKIGSGFDVQGQREWVSSSKTIVQILSKKGIKNFTIPTVSPNIAIQEFTTGGRLASQAWYVKKQIYDWICTMCSPKLLIFMSDNITKAVLPHTYLISIQELALHMLERGWGCTASPIGSNPNYHTGNTSCVQGYIMTPPNQLNKMALGTEFNHYPKGTTTLQDYADMHWVPKGGIVLPRAKLEDRFKGGFAYFDKFLGRALKPEYEKPEPTQTLSWMVQPKVA